MPSKPEGLIPEASKSPLDAVLARVAQAHSGGRADICEQESREALRLAPGDETASFFLGISLLRLGRMPEAIDVLTQLSSSWSPDDRSDPRGNRRGVELYLSIALRRVGDVANALVHAERAASFKRDDPETVCNLGLCLMDAGSFPEAEIRFRRMVELAPQAPFGYHGLACCYQHEGRNKEAIAQFRTAAKLSPPNSPVLVEIAESLASLEDSSSAEAVARRAHEVAPSVRTNLLLASSMVERGRAREGEKYARDAVKADPSSGIAWAVLGVTQQALGQRAESDESLRRSVAILPGQGSAWHALVQNGNASLELAKAMEEAKRPGGLPDSDLSLLNYALGQCNERIGRFKESLDAYFEANTVARRLKFGDEKFDGAKYSEELMSVPNLLPDWSPPSGSLAAGQGPQPIFVFGMIRSGTTLVEQILSCHPEIGAAGEVQFWLENWRAAVKAGPRKIDYSVLNGLRKNYLRQLAETAPGKRFVVDKMPLNYTILGVLALAFPGSALIHVVRDRRDNCFSILATANRSRLTYMHDVEATAFAYGEYETLMERWHAALPGRILDVRYEELVSDQERVTRSLLERCGADWNEACLHPEHNERQASTPSVVQVKSPVYRSSIGRAKPFEEWLGEAWMRSERSGR